MILDIIVEPDGGVFYAYCPMLPGLHVAGDTEKEALRNAGDALSAYMDSMIKHGDPLPHSRSEARRFQAQRTETTYDCGLDESCLDEDGFVKAGGHPLHEPDQEGD